MIWIIIVLAAVLVVVIGLVSVGDAVGKTEAMPDQIVIDAEEAIEFCAEALPDDVTAQLSYDELRRLIRLHLEWVQAYHWSPASIDATPIVFEQFDPVSYVMERAGVVGLGVSAAQAAAVVAAHTDYLVVSGALHLDDPALVQEDLEKAPLLEADRRPLLDSPDESPGTGPDDSA